MNSAMAIGRILVNGTVVGSGFVLATKLGEPSRVALTANHIVRNREANSLQFAGAGCTVAVERVQHDDNLDIAVLHLTEALPEGLAVGEPLEGAGWQVEARPRGNDPKLTGTITASHREFKNAQEQDNYVMQLDVAQILGDYEGYSGSPVTLPSPAGVVVGVLVEQLRWRRADPSVTIKPASNVLYAIPIKDVLDTFGLDAARAAPARSTGETALAAANDLLTELPLKAVPEPSPLPSGSRMRLSPNPLFVGREAELRALASVLKGGETAAIGQAGVTAATGMGGIGKTQLAAEFVHRYGQYFAGGVYWLSFADASAIPAEVVACGGVGYMELPGFSDMGFEDRAQAVLAALRSPIPRLLVFDNCEGEDLLARWRPPTGGCRVLVTSRREHWDLVLAVRPVPLDELPPEQSVELLRKHRPDLAPDDKLLGAIADELGYLPLALHLAGSFLNRYRHLTTPGRYLEQLRDPRLLKHRSLRGGGISPTGHAQDVGRAFALSYERLDGEEPTDAVAIALLARAAYFAPGEPIPRRLLLSTVELPENDPDVAFRAEDALNRLTDCGLLETEAEGALRLHRLLSAFVRNRTTDGEAQDAVERVMVQSPYRLMRKGHPESEFLLQPHLRLVTDRAQQTDDERAADLSTAMGTYLQEIGDYAGARSLYERALQIRERVLGPDHPETSVSLNNLGGLLYIQGYVAGARPFYERALQARERVFGPEDPNIAASLGNLAAILRMQGDYAGARSLYERALQIRERVLGPDHPETATTLNNLGLLLKEQGDYVEARSLYEQALRIRERVFGLEDYRTATTLNNLGLLLKEQGDYAGARSLYERVLRDWERVFGPEYYLLPVPLVNLASLLRDQGKYGEAYPLYERALEISERQLGWEHPQTRHIRQLMDALE